MSASICRRLSPTHLVPPSWHQGSRAALHNNISSSNHLAHRSNDTWLVYHAVCPFTAHVSNAYLLKTQARTPVRYLMLPAMQNISSHSRTRKTSHIATFIPQVIFPFCRSFPPSFKYWIFTVASLGTPLSNLINEWLLNEILSVLPAHSLCIKLSTVLTQPHGLNDTESHGTETCKWKVVKQNKVSRVHRVVPGDSWRQLRFTVCLTTKHSHQWHKLSSMIKRNLKTKTKLKWRNWNWKIFHNLNHTSCHWHTHYNRSRWTAYENRVPGCQKLQMMA